MTTQKNVSTLTTALVLATTALLLPGDALALDPVSGPGVFQPAPAILITYDNSLSMDFTETAWQTPDYPDDCQPWSEEYARTRNIVGIEALTGSFHDYCPIEVARDDTPTTRDDSAGVPHTRASYSLQRRDGLLDVYGDMFAFGIATFDQLISPDTGGVGDYSYAPTYGTSMNVGLANDRSSQGGLVTALPPGWLPNVPGAVSSFRLHNTSVIQEVVRNVVPGGGTPIGSELDDVQYWRHRDAGVNSDPFAECRQVAHILVTDGEPYWDRCFSSFPPRDSYRSCSTYSDYYSSAVQEASNLANGTNCSQCGSDTTVRQVPAYVLSFATEATNIADDLAEAGGTCALFDENNVCIRHAFRAEAQAGLLFAMGTIFNRQLRGEMSLSTPLTSTVAFEGNVGVVRFRTSANVSLRSPYWTGSLTRELELCQSVDDEEGNEFLALLPGQPMQFEEQYTPAFVHERNIYTARLDIAQMGASCARPYCPIDSHGCYESGAVPDPMYDNSLSGFGDGTGGLDSGGHNPGVFEQMGGPECAGDEYEVCEAGCDGFAPCLAECQRFFNCGTEGWTGSGAPECIETYIVSCVGLCIPDYVSDTDPNYPLYVDYCTCSCEEYFDCGECADVAAVTSVPDVYSRNEIDDRLIGQRGLAGLRGNDDPLPYAPPGVDFDSMEMEDTCLIEFDLDNFVENNDMSDYMYTAGRHETERTVRFVRGENLSDLADRGLLGDVFDPATVALQDRSSYEYVGDFYHSDMDLASQPYLTEHQGAGWLEFVNQYGSGSDEPRPFVLYIGGNDGMLHAYNARSGEELWGIIPPSFIPQLTQTLVAHRVTIDGPVTVRDLRCSQDEDSEVWCTLLAVSYRGGGSGVMLLDVTNPYEPRFLYEVTGHQIPELGMGYTRPLLGNMAVQGVMQPVVIITGGRPLGGPAMPIGDQIRGSHEGEAFVIMNAVTGEIYRQFDPVSHPALFAQCGPVTGSPSGWTPSSYTRFFAGTQYGCMLRVDASSRYPSEWTIEALYQTRSKGEINYPPAVATKADGTLVIVFGHGNTDQFEQVNAESNLVSINESRTSVATDVDEERGGYYTLGGANANWEITLAPGEFLTTAPIIANGVVYVATWVPNPGNPCALGSPHLYGINFIGDTSVSGSNSDEPHVVSVNSNRILGQLENPFYDPNDDESEPFIRYLDEQHLGAGSVVSALSIDPVPSCDILRVESAGEYVDVVGGLTRRELVIDVMMRGPSGVSGGGEEDGGGDESSPTDEDMISMAQFEQNLPSMSTTVLLTGASFPSFDPARKRLAD